MLSRNIGELMAERGFEYPFSLLGETLRAADITVVNLEGPISSRGENRGSIYSFRADPRAVEALAAAGIDAVSLANNHLYDWGPDALADTIALLDGAGIAHAGAGTDYAAAHAPALIEAGGMRFALLSYTTLAPRSLAATSSAPAIAGAATTTIASGVAAAKAGAADAVIVSFHFGDEYAPEHNPLQERLARAAIDAGAALVVGHHPHVPQELEYYNGGAIAYSLGNLIFDQNFDEATSRGLLLKAVFENGALAEVTPVPIAFTSDYRPYVVQEELQY